MFRSSASHGLLRGLNTAAQPSFRAAAIPTRTPFRSQLCTLSRRPQISPVAQSSVLTQQVVRLQTSRANADAVDTKAEAKVAHHKLQADPSIVSAASSIHPILGEVGGASESVHDTEMLAGVKHDVKTIQDTFSLQNVPREAYYIGLAGVLPYVATSLSTVYCAFEIHRAAEVGTGFFVNGKTAEALLHVLEPLQIGYGATIISFLGAIHWGLEWAAYGGTQGYPRYAIGVAATAMAWPTILMPVEYALITQFLIFNFMYYNDSRATKRGWAPAWYGVYRFVLTFIVGSAIVVSLVGRGQIADRVERPAGPADRVMHLRNTQVEPEDEAARKKYLPKSDDDEEKEDEDDSDDE